MIAEIGGVLKALGIGRFVEAVWSRFSHRVVVKEIVKYNDSDIDDTLDLYEKMFKEYHRIPASDLVEWLNPNTYINGADQPLLQCLLIAKRQGNTVGLLKALYCPESKCSLISYFCIDKRADPVSRKVASKLIIKFFRKFVRNQWRGCEAVLFEAEIPYPGLKKDDIQESKARLRLFRDIARFQGTGAYRIKIKYSQPKTAESEKYSSGGKNMALVIVPTLKRELTHLTKSDVERCVKFLILGVYGKTQTVPKLRQDVYSKYLQKVFEGTVRNLPENVELET